MGVAKAILELVDKCGQLYGYYNVMFCDFASPTPFHSFSSETFPVSQFRAPHYISISRCKSLQELPMSQRLH